MIDEQKPRGSLPAASPPALIKLLLLSPLLLAAVIIATLQPVRIGDGTEYLLSTVAFATAHHPFITPAVMNTYNALLEKQPMLAAFRATPATVATYGPPIPTAYGASYDARHFWFIGLLTAPGFWLARALHLHFAHSYTLLFASLWIVLLVIAWRRHHLPGLLSAVILLFLSPALWFVDKAHTESLTMFCLTAAVIYLSVRRLPPALFLFSLAATQNPALSVITLLLLAFWIAELRGALPRLSDNLWVFTSIGLTLLSPTYYYFRRGILSPVISAGYSSSAFISLRKIESLFVDPDLGLYPNWPLGLLILLAALAAAFTWRERPSLRSCWKECSANLPLTCSIAAFLVVMPVIQSTQPNVNGGGTIHMSRYALWYIPFHYLLLLSLFRTLPPKWPRPFRDKALALSAMALLIPAAWFNIMEFKPGGTEIYLEHSPAALLFYNFVPEAFNPVPEVFIRRSSYSVDPGAIPVHQSEVDPRSIRIGASTAYDQHVWAFGMPGCRKLYVLSGMLHLPPQAAPGLPVPIGCSGPASGAALYALALRHAPAAGDFYLSLSRADLAAALPTLHLDHLVGLSSAESQDYLGEGWSNPEPGFRWTDGPQAVIGFRTDPQEVSRPLAFRLDAAGYAQKVPQVADFQVNGAAAGTFSWRDGEQKVVEIPVQPDAAGKVIISIRILHPMPPHTSPDTRALGLMVRSLQLVAP